MAMDQVMKASGSREDNMEEESSRVEMERYMRGGMNMDS